MTTVAVTAASTPIGRALLERLDGDARVDRIVAVDGVPPEMPVAKLEFRRADVRDRLLPLAFDGADVVVHLGVGDAPSREVDTRFAIDVHGTRNVLDAVAKAGVGRLVHRSNGAVYGAHPDNPLPLDEQAPLRANPDFTVAYHALLAEELVAEWVDGHPDTRVTVLRSAPVLGRGADSYLGRLLLQPRLVIVKGWEPPMQFVHVDDLAAALHLAATGDLSGVYNVSADGWLAIDEACGVLGTSTFELPEAMAFGLVQRAWDWGVWPAPAGSLHHLMHPCVMSSERLHSAGWAPAYTNREILREFAAEHRGQVALGTSVLERRRVAAAGAVAAAVLAGLVLRARRGRRRAARA